MYNPFSLENKTILVTGASSGIGRAIAVECSKMGGNVIITGRNQERLSETFSSMDSGNHSVYTIELTNIFDLERFVNSLPELDGVVSNAGIIEPMVLKLMETKDVEKIFQVNTIAPIQLTRMLLQNKKIKKGSSIVYISSINGNNVSSAGNSIYGSTKSALSGFIKGAALELAPRNIRVNSINPGMIETDLFKGIVIGNDEIEKDRLKYPLKRYGKPEEVAYAAIYLLSDASQWITGTSLLMDGGYTLQ